MDLLQVKKLKIQTNAEKVNIMFVFCAKLSNTSPHCSHFLESRQATGYNKVLQNYHLTFLMETC